MKEKKEKIENITVRPDSQVLKEKFQKICEPYAMDFVFNRFMEQVVKKGKVDKTYWP